MNQAQSSDAFVVAWSHLRVNGLRPGPRVEFGPTTALTWQGRRIEFPGGALATERTIARAVTRLAGRERFRDGLCREEPLIEQHVALTDGHRIFKALVVRTLELSRPFLVFVGGLPPQNTELRVHYGPVLPPEAEPARVEDASPAGERPLRRVRAR